MCELMFWLRCTTDWLYADNPDCTDALAAYVMGEFSGTLCSLTKAFLFNSISGEFPENHSWWMNVCPSGGGGNKQGAEGI